VVAKPSKKLPNTQTCSQVVTNNLPILLCTMAPNANITRRSNGLASKATVSTQDLDNDPALQSVRTMKSLKGTEIAIDGVIYDIADFVHPGGEVVKFFGGNDVTVQYKMIHPYHTNKHLEKMKMVGKVVDYEPE
jgi:fatty acid desaturase (delta-4 desaturase)